MLKKDIRFHPERGCYHADKGSRKYASSTEIVNSSNGNGQIDGCFCQGLKTVLPEKAHGFFENKRNLADSYYVEIGAYNGCHRKRKYIIAAPDKFNKRIHQHEQAGGAEGIKPEAGKMQLLEYLIRGFCGFRGVEAANTSRQVRKQLIDYHIYHIHD